MSARAAIHAMFQLDEAATAELDLRLDALVVEALLAAGVQYVDCPVCGAGRPVVGECGTCAFEARMAAELAARGLAAPAEAAPEFFQAGHIYTREHHGRTIEFHVRLVDTAPDWDFPTAFGFRKDPEIDVMLPMDADDFHGCGWTDVTEAGDRRG